MEKSERKMLMTTHSDRVVRSNMICSAWNYGRIVSACHPCSIACASRQIITKLNLAFYWWMCDMLLSWNKLTLSDVWTVYLHTGLCLCLCEPSVHTTIWNANWLRFICYEILMFPSIGMPTEAENVSYRARLSPCRRRPAVHFTCTHIRFNATNNHIRKSHRINRSHPIFDWNFFCGFWQSQLGLGTFSSFAVIPQWPQAWEYEKVRESRATACGHIVMQPIVSPTHVLYARGIATNNNLPRAGGVCNAYVRRANHCRDHFWNAKMHAWCAVCGICTATFRTFAILFRNQKYKTDKSSYKSKV